MIIALASPKIAISMEDGLKKVEKCLAKAAAAHAEIICFPEAYLPGLRGTEIDIDVLPFDEQTHDIMTIKVAQLAKNYGIAVILGTERLTSAGKQIAAYVFDQNGEKLGQQIKCQLDPSEEPFYIPGEARQIFEVNGVKFGIAICHEGWRYPETVRWAAVHGAKIVFHPMHTGSDTTGSQLTEWGSTAAPYYERAMMCRSIENTIYFASVNYGLRYPEAATSLIAPDGCCQAFLPYGEAGVLIEKIDIAKATGLMANRYAPKRY